MCEGLKQDFLSQFDNIDYIQHFAVVEDAVNKFSQISRDQNPIHLDEEYAKKTRFGQRIAHGMLIASFISASIANRWPGAIYMSQSLDFLKPVYLNSIVTVYLIVKETKGNKLIVETVAKVENNEVVRGEAKILWEKN